MLLGFLGRTQWSDRRTWIHRRAVLGWLLDLPNFSEGPEVAHKTVRQSYAVHKALYGYRSSFEMYEQQSAWSPTLPRVQMPVDALGLTQSLQQDMW